METGNVVSRELYETAVAENVELRKENDKLNAVTVVPLVQL